MGTTFIDRLIAQCDHDIWTEKTLALHDDDIRERVNVLLSRGEAPAAGVYEAIGRLTAAHERAVAAVDGHKPGWNLEMDRALVRIIAEAWRMLRRDHISDEEAVAALRAQRPELAEVRHGCR